MAKKMLHQVTASEKAELAKLKTDEEVKAAIKAMDLSGPDAMVLSSQIIGGRMAAATQNQGNEVVEAAMAALGVSGVGTAMAVTRVAELLKGMQMRYEAFLNLEELAGRLRTLMGDKYRVMRIDAVSIALIALADGSRLCEVRLSPEDGAKAASVTVSRPNTDKAKDTAGDVADEALRRATRPGGFGGLSGLVDLGKRVVSTAMETAGQLSDVNAVIETIEAYGAEQENLAASARRKLAQNAEMARLDAHYAKHCRNCETSFSPGATNCSKCGASVG